MYKKIAILGAMEIEIEVLKNIYKNYKVHRVENIEIFEIVEDDKQIFFTNSQIGKVFSSIVTTLLITKFNVECVIFTGIAGSLNRNYKILDVAIASKLCQHDVDISAFGHPLGFIPGGKIFLESDKTLVTKLKQIGQKLKLDIKEGIIATGDQFISTTEQKEHIKKTFNADMIEMEGASVAVSCDTFNIPFIITRTISDSADEEGVEDFNKFMTLAANKNASLITLLIKEL